MKQLKCENCGAPAINKKCEYCGSEQHLIFVGDNFSDFINDDIEIRNCSTSFAYQFNIPTKISIWSRMCNVFAKLLTKK